MSNAYEIPKLWTGIWTSLVTAFIVGPLVVIFLVSFTPHDRVSFPDTGISFRWYVALLGRGDFIHAALNSLMLALVAVACSLAMGIAASFALVRFRFPFSDVVRVVLLSPLLVPMILSGLAILTVFSAHGWSDQPSRLLVAHLALVLPYIVRTVTSSLQSFDRDQELAARNLGAHPLTAFFRITLPQIGPGIFAGALFGFVVSFDDVGLSILLSGTQFSTLPVQLFNYAMYDNDPLAATVSVCMVVFSVVAVIVLERTVGVERLMR